MAPIISHSSHGYHLASQTVNEYSFDGSYTETLLGSNGRPSVVSKGNDSAESTELPTPSQRSGRNLILCFDGTGDQFDNDNSNVVEFFSMLKKDNPEEQQVYYQAGIGTYTSPVIATPLAAKISKTLDTAIAWNLGTHITDGYEFLMQNYRAGDKICIFGFSRGAYTARCLIGMIFKVGLLPMCNHQQVPFAYHMYTLADEEGWKMSNSFRKTFSIEVDIEFVGLWDSVDSVGLIPRTLPFATSKSVIRTFRHALALDEHRAKFKANVWNNPTEAELRIAATGLDPDNDILDKESWDRIYGKYDRQPTDIQEVWFAGCHCDVGGGSVPNGTKPNLARIPLRWMIRECFKRNTRIIFIREKLKSTGINIDTLLPDIGDKKSRRPELWSPEKPISHSQGTTEEMAEYEDALSPMYDQLELARWWRILEYIPLHYRYESKGEVHYEWKCNRGAGRHIKRPVRDDKKENLLVHRSVQIRRDRYKEPKTGSPYQWKADLQKKIDSNHVEWVD